MQAGTLSHSQVGAGSTTIVFTVPATCLYGEIDISVCNLTSTEASCSVTIGGDTNYLYRNYPITGNDTMFSKSEICSPGDVVKVNPGSDVSVRISGKIHYK